MNIRPCLFPSLNSCSIYFLPFSYHSINFPFSLPLTKFPADFLIPELNHFLKEPSLLPLCHTALGHKSVDMRKATVFIIVEMYYVLGDELDLDEFSDSQRRLIDVYVDRHPKKSQVMRTEQMESAQPIAA